MNANTSIEQPKTKSDTTSGVVKRLIQVSVILLIQAAVLFLSSGRLNWMMAWVYIGVYAGIVVINALIILPKNPELIAERGQIKEDAKDWDKLLASLASILGPLGIWIVAGLDVRFSWSPPFGLVVQIVALVFLVLGYGLVSWAMASNKFFSGVVRIQKERGHTVATTGPYQYVRHPGYTGMITFSLAGPVMLGSLWALIPAGLTAGIFVIRTALEDKTLQDELDGYQDYSKRVHYRLVPGVW
jgi:protein-S-isoprenylcysteine O-methyltransferase Ste14